VKPNLPIAALSALAADMDNVGSNVSMALEIRSPRSNSALLKPGATVRSWRTRRRFSGRENGVNLPLKVQTAEGSRRECADRLQTAEMALAAADRDARAALEAASAAREELARTEERFEGAKRRLSDIGREIRDMLEVEPPAVAELAEIGPTDSLPDLVEVEEKLERCGVNVNAWAPSTFALRKNCDEVEAQHSSLTTETRRPWLRQSRNCVLPESKVSIAKHCERLLTSFEQVNKHFQHHLYGIVRRGDAELQLIENEDPLEAGLENSGQATRQKTCDAVCCFRAGTGVDRTRVLSRCVSNQSPAPNLCVMDVVDAHTRRSQRRTLLRSARRNEKATDTRFVIITHNPITMARMNRLYGVYDGERWRVSTGVCGSGGGGSFSARCELAQGRTPQSPDSPARLPINVLKTLGKALSVSGSSCLELNCQERELLRCIRWAATPLTPNSRLAKRPRV
jgi:hypothetical protein